MVSERLRTIGLLGISGVALAWAVASLGQTDDVPLSPANEQLAYGKQAYLQNCAACHGQQMNDGQFAPALKGASFLAKWGDAPLSDLYDYMHSSMPPAASRQPQRRHLCGDRRAGAARERRRAGRVVKAGEMGGMVLPAAPVAVRGETGVGASRSAIHCRRGRRSPTASPITPRWTRQCCPTRRPKTG